MMFQRPYRCNYNNNIWFNACLSCFYIQKFFRSKVSRKSCLSYNIV